MSFLTPQDFNKIPFSIANATENAETIQVVIDGTEESVLEKVLGLVLYQEFQLGLESLPGVWNEATAYDTDDEIYQGVTVWRALQPNTGVVPSEGVNWTKVRDDKWLKLRDGSGFEYNNKPYKYKGVEDFLRPLVVYNWLKDFVLDTQTDSGIAVSEMENAAQQGPRDRMVQAWNYAANAIGCKSTVARSSLYWFLQANLEDYSDLEFEPLVKQNYFDF